MVASTATTQRPGGISIIIINNHTTQKNPAVTLTKPSKKKTSNPFKYAIYTKIKYEKTN